VTVAELIEKLKELPQDAVVVRWLDGWRFEEYHPVYEVCQAREMEVHFDDGPKTITAVEIT